MSSTETLFEIEGPVATFTFNRPEARNALTWEMYEGLVLACDRVDREPGVRVFVLRGAGESAFAAGTDILQFRRFQDAEDGVRYEARIESVLDRLARVAVPTIAQVQGIAAGGGCAIALTCDLRVCAPNAGFSLPIARTLGNYLSAGSIARLLALLGPSMVKDISFTGRTIWLEEAQALGLVSRLAAADALEAAVRDLCMAIAANAPLTVRASKEAVRRLERQARPSAQLDADLIRLCYGSEDFREGVASFLAKRKPRWRGV